MRCLTIANITNQTKAASLLRFWVCPVFPIHGIAHTKSHCSHNKALGCHAHVDQVNGHFGISPALQFIQSICNNCCKTRHSNGDKWCFFSFSNKFRSLIFII